MNAYFIPGLGTDGRIFQNLVKHFDFTEINYLDFREELIAKSADLREYAQIIAPEIKHNKDSIIIGLSLGGILATELSKLLPDCKIVLISSIKTTKEAPFVLKIARLLPFYNLVPLWFSRNIVPLIGRIFNVIDKEGYHLYRQMLKGWSYKKFRWARKSAVNWKNIVAPDCLHIHGTRDLIFPHKKIKAAVILKKGGHYMVMNRAEEIAHIIKNWLQKD
jgi:pimeloyl-ACP methyl ester carboxylesterase